MGHEVTDVDFAQNDCGYSWPGVSGGPPGSLKWSRDPVHVGSLADRTQVAEIDRLRAEITRLRGLVIDLSDAITNWVDTDVIGAEGFPAYRAAKGEG